MSTNKTHTVKDVASQGDVMFIRVGSQFLEEQGLPEDATFSGDKDVIVAHSETGHHHVVEAPGPVAYHTTPNPLIAYLEVQCEFADIVHKRTDDTHEALRIPEGTWKILRQQESTPQGWRMVQD